MNHHTTTSILGLLISSAVLLGSLHVSQALDNHKIAQHDDGSVAKISVDLHHHSDKSQQSGDNPMYVDGRSLKLHRHSKQKARTGQWLHAWWQLHSLNVLP